MNTPIDHSTIAAAQELLLDQLDGGRTKRKALAFKAAMPGATKADEEALDAQDAAIRRLELKLEGLGFGIISAEADERNRLSEERLARRRDAAVNILALVNRRYWATETMDEAMTAFHDAAAEVERLGDRIKFEIADWFVGDDASRANLHLFLSNIDAIGLTDTNYKVQQDITGSRSYSRGLPPARPHAVSALANALPEASDPEVQKAAVAAARQQQAEEGGH